MTDQIAAIEVGTLYKGDTETGHLLPGEYLTMKDGSVWFHPYNGGAPRKITSLRHGE